jgi:lactose/L-arabinose transport system ATP-binding protein
VFLFDEPLSNLDAELRVQMRVELARLHAELGVTMIYVTHDQVEAMTLADRIVVLRDGRIEQIGAPLELYRDPANQFVAGFVGSPRMNFMAAEVTASDPAGISLALVNHVGARLVLPPVSGVLTGDRLVVGLRPEHFADVGSGDCDLAVAVDVVEHLGSSCFVYANTKGEQMIVGRPDDPAGFGDRLTVSIPAARTYLFDAAGQRLRAADQPQGTRP